MSRIFNHWIEAAVSFHNILNRLCPGWGTRNASLEYKLLQNLMAMGEEILYRVFLGLWKD